VTLSFRQRLFTWLLVVAALPAGIAVAVALFAPEFAAPAGGATAWERAAHSWRDAREALARGGLASAESLAVQRHDAELSLSLRRARQAQTIRNAFSGVLAGVAMALAVLVGGGAVQLAGHLSRQLSRPIDELVDWTARLARGEKLPDAPPAKGAPEFGVLREAFRRMAGELETARAREVEAAELRAFRETARQVAHELKNPLTPLRFALQRLSQSATGEQRELLSIIDAESARIEGMAHDFSTLGRLPEGPPAGIDLAELLEQLARGGAPDGVTIQVNCERDLPRVVGHYEALRRALHNLVLNACDAVGPGGEVVLSARPVADRSGGAVAVSVHDNGPGMTPEVQQRIFEPYFTTKRGGTGLGLVLVRQTVHDHGGTLSVESTPGAGTTFTLTIPVERA
jgi:signal transduction histidine kinase